MRKVLIMLLCAMAMPIGAQRLNRQFSKTALSDALVWLDKAQTAYRLNFIYDELEDFSVTTTLRDADLRTAIAQLVGFYPIRATFDGDQIYLECTQREPSKVIGQVVDEHGRPMEFVNVTLLSPTDSTYIGGGVTNEAGDYVIPSDRPQVLARYSFVGYKTVYRRLTTGKAGTTAMQRDAITLGKVVVKANKPLFQRKENKVVFNVSELEGAESMSATDALKYAPRVMVDGNGKVSVGGKGATIYVNDRRLSSSEATSYLTSLKASDIQSVEIQASRGSEDDGDISGGIINIKTKIRLGLGGSATLYGSVYPQRSNYYHYYPLVNLFFGTERWNLYASTYWLNSHYNGASTTNHYFVQTNTRHDQQTDYMAHTNTRYLNLGSIYTIDRKRRHSLGLEMTATITNRDDHSTDNAVFTDSLGRQYQGASWPVIDAKIDYLNVVTYYKWQIDERDSYLKVLANYNYNHGTNDSYIAAVYDNYEPLHTDMRDYDTSNANNGSLQADMRYNLKGGLALRTGAKYESSVRTDILNETNHLNDEVTGTSWKYRENISAAYVGLSKNLTPKIFANVSLRMENTWQKGINRLSGQTELDRHYTNWLPYAYFSHKLTDKWNYNVSFVTHIYRPSFSDLSNYKNRLSSVLYTQGNPELQPSINYHPQLEVNYGAHSLALSYYYTKDVIADYFETIGGKTYRQTINFGSQTATELNYAFNGKLLPWWRVNVQAMCNYVTIPQSYNQKYSWQQSLTWQNYLTFKDIGNFEVGTIWQSDVVLGNYRAKGRACLDLAYNRTFCHDQLSLRVGANDVFHSFSDKGHQINPILEYRFYGKRYTQLYLRLTYTFKSKHSVRRDQIENDNSVRNRM